MTIEISLPHNFIPRPYQIPMLRALDRGIKRAVWVCHRRAGKDVTIFNWCIKRLMEEPATCFYVMPSYAQAKKVIWDAINIQGQKILDYIPKPIIASANSQEMKIRLINGSLFQLIGSDNIDSLMGTNPKIVVFSEYALQDPAAWDYIRPILKVNKGVAIFISTPRGKNHFWELSRTAQVTEGWFYERLTVEDTGVLTPKDIEQERAEGMSEELIQQEYYVSFDRGIEGSFYGTLLQKMQRDERIGVVSYDPYKLVHVAFDLGWDDATALIYFQIDGAGNVYIIDAEEYIFKRFSDIKDSLMAKPYKYGTYLFPHDVEVVDGQGTGCTRREILEQLDIPVTTVDKTLIADGIETVRKLMSSRLYIDEKKCQKLLKSLEFYHKEWNDKHQIYSNKPVHDWSSHFSDSLRYLAMGLHKIPGADVDLDNDAKALRSYFGG
jgi:hypothetical protein